MQGCATAPHGPAPVAQLTSSTASSRPLHRDQTNGTSSAIRGLCRATICAVLEGRVGLHWVKVSNTIGKGNLRDTGFPPLLRHIKIGYGPETHPYQKAVSSQPLLDPLPCVRTSLPVSESVCPLFGFRVCVTWHLASPTAVSVPCGERAGPSAAEQEGRRVCACWWPCIGCWEGPTRRGGPMPSMEMDLSLLLFHVNTALFHPVLNCLCSLAAVMPGCSGQKCFL